MTDSGTERKLTGSVRNFTKLLAFRTFNICRLTQLSVNVCVNARENYMYMYDDYGCVCKHFCYYVIFVRRRFFVIKIKSYSSFSMSIVYTYYCGLDMLGWPFKLSIATFVTILEFCTYARERYVWNSLIYFFKRFTICSTIRGFSELWIFSFVFFRKPWDLS